MTETPQEAMRFLPVGLDLRGRACVVVGGGTVGTRKTQTLIRAGALLTVVSPSVTEELSQEITAGRVRWIKENFREEHLAGAFLVVAATDDPCVNSAAAGTAASRGALICNTTSAERTQVIFGALLDLDEATLAVFTDGRNPALAAEIRTRIASLLRDEDRRL